MGVEEAVSPGGPIEPEPTEPTEAPFITTEMAIIIAAVVIAIGLIAGFFILKKRK
jgi:uracil-DNA glycosylase